MNSREQSRLQLEGRLRSLQCSCLLPSCIIAPNYPEDFLQRLTLPQNSISVHAFVLFNAAK